MQEPGSHVDQRHKDEHRSGRNERCELRIPKRSHNYGDEVTGREGKNAIIRTLYSFGFNSSRLNITYCSQDQQE